MRTLTKFTLIAMLVPACSSQPDAGPSVASGAPSTSRAGTSDPADDAPWTIQSDGKVVVVGADGSGSFMPAADVPPGEQTNPDWSPDGDRLVFVHTGDGRDDLWVVGVDGVGAREIAACDGPCIRFDDPAWSPDGASVVTCRVTEAEVGFEAALVSVDVESGSVTPVVEFPAQQFCAGPRWSPNGSAIVLEVVEWSEPSLSGDAVGVSVTVVDLTASPPLLRPLTDPSQFAREPDWSGQDDLIVYGKLPTADDEAFDLFTIRPNGTDERRRTTIAETGGSAVQPSFDGAGDTVVFVDETSTLLRRVDLETGEVTPAFAGEVFGNHPRVRPLG